MEFSKKWLIGCIVISVFFTLLSYVLAFFDKNPVESLSTEIIRTIWLADGVCFVGYNFQNSVRAFSKNKYFRGTDGAEETNNHNGGNNRGI